MYVHDKKEDCCGCTACMTICSVNAITMENDEEGFKYPKINEKKCIHCNMCRKVCDFVKQHDWDALPRPVVYAAKQKSDKERAASQSGGLFAALSDAVLAMGGVVYGAAYDGEWNVIHKRAETKKHAMKCGEVNMCKAICKILSIVLEKILRTAVLSFFLVPIVSVPG